MGLYPDKNAETFFSEQVGGVAATVLGKTIKLINYLIELNIIKPIIYHVTRDEESSFISSGYKPIQGLIEK